MTDQDVPRWDYLPVFPLPRLVLMPGEIRALHVFEPRYRELLAWALSDTGHFAIGTLQPGFEGEYGGKPSMWPEMGVGKVVAHHTFEDGRSNLLLAYLQAATIEEELSTDHSFRVVRALPRDVLEVPDSLDLERLRLVGLQLVGRDAESGEAAEVVSKLRGGPLLDVLARLFVTEDIARRRYLAEPTVMGRYRLVEDALLTQLAMGPASGSA